MPGFGQLACRALGLSACPVHCVAHCVQRCCRGSASELQGCKRQAVDSTSNHSLDFALCRTLRERFCRSVLVCFTHPPSLSGWIRIITCRKTFFTWSSGASLDTESVSANSRARARSNFTRARFKAEARPMAWTNDDRKQSST